MARAASSSVARPSAASRGPIALLAHQVRYDVRASLRNPRARFFTFFFPIVLLVVFTGVFGHGTTIVDGVGKKSDIDGRIAQIIDTSEENVRQLVTRARRHVHERRPRFASSREQLERLAARFFAAAQSGDLEVLEELLAHDVVLHADSGGKAPAVRRAVHGRTKVARLLVTGLRAGNFRGIKSRREEVNGQPGALFFDHDGRLASVVVLDIADGQIQTVSLIVNPDKLRHLGPVANLGALLRDRK